MKLATSLIKTKKRCNAVTTQLSNRHVDATLYMVSRRDI